jgi:serine/threonine protein kinase
MTTAISIEDVRREVKMVKALSGHQNLVKFYDACEDGLNVYIVMEYVLFYLIPILAVQFLKLNLCAYCYHRLCEGGELLDRILARYFSIIFLFLFFHFLVLKLYAHNGFFYYSEVEGIQKKTQNLLCCKY